MDGAPGRWRAGAGRGAKLGRAAAGVGGLRGSSRRRPPVAPPGSRRRCPASTVAGLLDGKLESAVVVAAAAASVRPSAAGPSVARRCGGRGWRRPRSPRRCAPFPRLNPCDAEPGGEAGSGLGRLRGRLPPATARVPSRDLQGAAPSSAGEPRRCRTLTRGFHA